MTGKPKRVFLYCITPHFWTICGVVYCFNKVSKKVTKDEWYVGGTLHKAKVSEWKSATEKNKLATCADFMVNVDNTLSASELKETATALKICINEVIWWRYDHS